MPSSPEQDHPDQDHPERRANPTPFDRAGALDRLASDAFDVLIIGGGITGVGVALDAASRGLRTALVEKDDFASGTSSKSSKLVHGGLRYLQQHEFRLVYENLAERQRLLENAPHLVSPLPFLIPLFGRDGAVNRGVARVYRTALRLYDLTGGIRIGRHYQRISRQEALAHLPTLQTDRLAAGFLYWDARTDDARLTLAVLRTAVLDHGAVAVNHAGARSLLIGAGGRVEGATIAPDDGDPFPVHARVVVNATGVWADDVAALEGRGHPASIQPAKGVHITVPAAALPCDIAAVIPVAKDRRSIFVVPWGDQVYLGTTDTAWDGPLDDPTCLPEDVDYILGAVNAVVTRPVRRADVTGVWAGLRPLLAAEPGKHAPSERTADLSRRHTVRADASGVVTVTGGKLTTYRKMAEDTVDRVVSLLDQARTPCRTRDLRLVGAGTRRRTRPELASECRPRSTDRAGVVADHLAGRFGDETPAVLALTADHPELLGPLVPGLDYLRAEAIYAVRHEMACTLADVLERRTRAMLRDARATATAAGDVAALIGPELGWSEERCRQEAEAYAGAIRVELERAGLASDATVPGGHS
ncbi:MAG: glycerol-3-phosphate dehydrogenase/oxidase [Actinomycetota bacterium]|nr:glycerol-3-phosphate dehydrogenase/oxidase [Actinomycetota bacterium]